MPQIPEKSINSKVIPLKSIVGGTNSLWFRLNTKSGLEKKELTLDDGQGNTMFKGVTSSGQVVEVKNCEFQHNPKYSGKLTFVFKSVLGKSGTYTMLCEVLDESGSLLETCPYMGFKNFLSRLGVQAFQAIEKGSVTQKKEPAQEEKGNLEKIKISELISQFANDFQVGTVFQVFDQDGSIRNDFEGHPLELVVFENGLKQKSLRILKEEDDEVGACGRYFLNSLVAMIFDPDEILYRESGTKISLGEIDKKVYLKVKKVAEVSAPTFEGGKPPKQPDQVPRKEKVSDSGSPVTSPSPTTMSTPNKKVNINTPAKIEYVSLKELYDWWENHQVLLSKVLAFVKSRPHTTDLAGAIKDKFGTDIDKKYLLVAKNSFYMQGENSERLRATLIFIDNLLTQQRETQVSTQPVSEQKKDTVSEPGGNIEGSVEGGVGRGVDTNEITNVESKVEEPKFYPPVPVTSKEATTLAPVSKEGKSYDLRLISLALRMGFKASQICGWYRVSRNAILGLIHRHGGSERFKNKYTFSPEEIEAFTRDYGQPLSSKAKKAGWSEARRTAMSLARQVKSLVTGTDSGVNPKKHPPDLQSLANASEKERKKAEAKEKYVEILKSQGELVYSQVEIRKIVEKKFSWIVMMLKWLKDNESVPNLEQSLIDYRIKNFGVGNLNWIGVNRSGTAKTLPLSSTNDLQMMDTRIIEIEIPSPSTSQEAKVQRGLWFLLFTEFGKIRKGEHSPLSVFFRLDKNGAPENRLALTVKEKLGREMYTDTQYIPPQTGETVAVNYDQKEFESFEQKIVIPKIDKPASGEPKRAAQHRRGRISELPETVRRDMERRERFYERTEPDVEEQPVLLLPHTTPSQQESPVIQETQPVAHEVSSEGGEETSEQIKYEQTKSINEEKFEFMVSSLAKRFDVEEKFILNHYTYVRKEAVDARKMLAYFLKVKAGLTFEEVSRYLKNRPKEEVRSYVSDVLDDVQSDEGYRKQVDLMWDIINGEWNTKERRKMN